MSSLSNLFADFGPISPDNMMLYFSGFAATLLLLGALGLFRSRDQTAARVSAIAADMNGKASGLTK